MADFDTMDDLDDLASVNEGSKKQKRKKKKNRDGEEKEGPVSRLMTVFVILFIVGIWLVIFGLLIKYDVGEFGSRVLRPVLKDVPVLKEILPEVPDETVAEENNYPYRNLSEAMVRIGELEAELAELKGKKDGRKNYLAELEAEVQRLKTFEENQLQFETEKDKFDREVVFNEKAPDIEEYKKFYEEIDPDNAAEIYRQVIEQKEIEDKLAEQAEMYKSMEPVKAARILGGMSGDLELVARILLNMKTKESGAILQEMDPNMAAKITKKISLIQD